MKKRTFIWLFIILIGIGFLYMSSPFLYMMARSGYDKDLGNNYYYDDEKMVIKTDNQHRYDIVIPPTILKIKYNNQAIIAIVLNIKNEREFWIVSKIELSKYIDAVDDNGLHWPYTKYSNVYGPLDSLNYIAKTKGLNISLKFDDP